MRAVSFHILDLFADLFQLGFALDDNLGDLGVVCFSAERIQLAAEFLADELKRSPDGQLLVCRFEGLIQMRFEPAQFLWEIRASGEKRHVFCQVIIVESNLESDLPDTFEKERAIASRRVAEACEVLREHGRWIWNCTNPRTTATRCGRCHGPYPSDDR